MPNARNCVQENPTAEPENMHPHKGHAAAETRNLLSEAICGCPLVSGRFFESRYGVDILLGQLFRRWRS